LAEALQDLGSIYLGLYGRNDRTEGLPKLCENPEIIRGLKRRYRDFTDVSDGNFIKPDLEQDLKVLRELEEQHAEVS
jgi:hypothetical protein